MDETPPFGAHAHAVPAFRARGGSTGNSGLAVKFGKKFVQQELTLEDSKIPTHFSHIQGCAVGVQQGADIVEITMPPGIVDEALQLESHQPFRTDYPQPTHAGIALFGLRQQSARFWTVCVE